MFGSRYFASWYFRATYYRPQPIETPVQSVRFTAGGASRHYPLVGFLSADEKPDTLDALGIITGHDAVEMDNDFILLAAA